MLEIEVTREVLRKKCCPHQLVAPPFSSLRNRDFLAGNFRVRLQENSIHLQLFFWGITYAAALISSRQFIDIMAMTKGTRGKIRAHLLRLLWRMQRKALKALNIPIEYGYGTFKIMLPADHRLPEYQRTYPKYDRFLPHLVKHLNDSDVVIDIGANVGDTLAAMYEANSRLHYICIEADNDFFDHLIKNINRIKKSGNPIHVKAIKSLVGKSVSAASLEGKGGTKNAVASESGKIRSEPLDVLLDTDEKTSIRVLKTDVDGFDYDVLDSASSVIKASKPLIFFELQYDNEKQYAGYLNTLGNLESAGYTNWFIFDNFGSLMLNTNNMNAVEQLMSYVRKQNVGQSTRTVYYFDVLAAPNADGDFIRHVLKTY